MFFVQSNRLTFYHRVGAAHSPSCALWYQHRCVGCASWTLGRTSLAITAARHARCCRLILLVAPIVTLMSLHTCMHRKPPRIERPPRVFASFHDPHAAASPPAPTNRTGTSTPTDRRTTLTMTSSMQTLLLVVFSALAFAQTPSRAPAPAPVPARTPVPAPARTPASAPARAPASSVISASTNGASGFIRVQGLGFVDEQCRDFLPTGWNTYVDSCHVVTDEYASSHLNITGGKTRSSLKPSPPSTGMPRQLRRSTPSSRRPPTTASTPCASS